jgi:hypothetical protein
MSAEKFEQYLSEHMDKQAVVDKQVAKIQESLDTLGQNIKVDIFTAVKRVISQSKQAPVAASSTVFVNATTRDEKRKTKERSRAQSPTALSIPPEVHMQDIAKVLALKAEKVDVEALRENKTNKQDSIN